MNTSSTVKRVLFATGSLAPYLLVLCLSPPPSARADTITLVQIGGPYEPVVAVGLTNTASRQGVQIGIAFDPAILQVEAVSPGDRIVAPLQLHTSELDDGRLLLLIFDETRTRSGLPPSSPETETIARITFRSSGSVFEPRVTTVSVYGALLADSLLNPISSVTWQDLAITNRFANLPEQDLGILDGIATAQRVTGEEQVFFR